MPRTRPGAALWLERALAPVEALFVRVYGSALNPLYQSGTLAVLFFLTALASGIYLLIFYRVGAPYESTLALHGQPWAGRWIRALHRYAADAALAMVGLHALKMLVQGRTWGPRLLAWVSGVLLTVLFVVCGCSGLILVWDVQSQILAAEFLRQIDLLPILSEPLSRSFNGAEGLPRAFFFVVLFLHIATPLGAAGLFWLHLSRLSRPLLLPPRPLAGLALAALGALALLLPLEVLPQADLRALPGPVPVDLFYGFWLWPARSLGPAGGAVLMLAATLLALSVPQWWRPRVRPAPSAVDPRLCTGCTQCYQDCPYSAIRMVEREGRSPQQSARVALVEPSLCVSCGLCAGSCAPMGVGPPERTGRDQMRQMAAFLARHRPGPAEIVLFACSHGPGRDPRLARLPRVHLYPTGCSGSLHTSVMEMALRGGAGGVYVLSCPGRDCTHREGPRWLEERVYRDREAELPARVERRRVRLGPFSALEMEAALADIAGFVAEIASGSLPPQAALPPDPEGLAPEASLPCRQAAP